MRAHVREDAIFATDTSGGLFDALENFRRVNPGLCLEVDCDKAVAREVVLMLPPGAEPGWTLVGGVGEYALLYAVPAGTRVEEGLCIGHGAFRESGEIRLLSRGRVGRMRSAPPDWRSVPAAERIAAVARYWQALFAE